MKREKNYFYILIIVLFVITYVAAFVLGNRVIEFGSLTATASVLFYPLTYLLAILFAERYGKDRLFDILSLAILSLVIFALILTITSVLPVYNGKDGLELLFNVNYRIIFASIAGFFIGQNLNLNIYYFLAKKKKINFIISGVISITVDSLIFVILAFAGETSFRELLRIFSGQYVIGTTMMLIFSIGFLYLIDSVLKNRSKEIEETKVIKKETIKKPTVKKTPAKKPTTKTKKA